MEQEIADKTAEERYEERLKQAKPVLDAMFAWANSRTAAPKSALGKALNYLKEQWPYLTNYLKDGRLELSNNRAERSIKPFVIDRKNFPVRQYTKGSCRQCGDVQPDPDNNGEWSGSLPIPDLAHAYSQPCGSDRYAGRTKSAALECAG
ncbi:MAG: IS66 family transposase [Oscillospiraceae bacterium]